MSRQSTALASSTDDLLDAGVEAVVGTPSMPSSAPPPDLDARLEILKTRMAAAGFPVTVVSKVRTPEQQHNLYAQGRSRPGAIITEKSGTPGDESRHQLGMAADFAFTGGKGKENWNLLGQEAKNLGLEWGGDWKSLVDKPHVQMPRQATFQKGGSAGGVTIPGSAIVTQGPVGAALAARMPPPPTAAAPGDDALLDTAFESVANQGATPPLLNRTAQVAAALKLPATAFSLAGQVATNPSFPAAVATGGRVVGGLAPIAAGLWKGGLYPALAGMVASGFGANRGARSGRFVGQALQKAAVPFATLADKAATVANKANPLIAAQGALDLAQMAEPQRRDIGFLGLSAGGPRTPEEQAAHPALLNMLGQQGLQLVAQLRSQGLPTGTAIRQALSARVAALKGPARDLAIGTLNTLPMVGMMAGGALAAPETLGMGTIPAMAAGAGVGQGAKDLIGHATGLTPPTTPSEKALNIGTETALTGGTAAALELVRSPLTALRNLMRGGLSQAEASAAINQARQQVEAMTGMVQQRAAATAAQKATAAAAEHAAARNVARTGVSREVREVANQLGIKGLNARDLQNEYAKGVALGQSSAKAMSEAVKTVHAWMKLAGTP